MFNTAVASNNTVIAFNEPSDILLLISAIKDGDLNTAKVLLESNPNLNLDQCDNEGMNALMIAAQNGHSAIVKLLIEASSLFSYAPKDDLNLEICSIALSINSKEAFAPAKVSTDTFVPETSNDAL